MASEILNTQIGGQIAVRIQEEGCRNDASAIRREAHQAIAAVSEASLEASVIVAVLT